MSLINNFIAQYGATIIYAIITAVIGYLGIIIKNTLRQYFSEKEKREIIKNAVHGVVI